MSKFNGLLYMLAMVPVSLGFSGGAAAAVEQFSFPLEEIVSCPTADGYSEEIYLFATARVQIQSVDVDGHGMSRFFVFWSGEGHGLASGAEYLLSGRWMEVIQDRPPFIFLWNDHFQLIGKGKAENFNTYWKIRFVTDPDGNTRVDFEDSVECEATVVGP